jgi:hypothetical protein
MGPLVEQTSLRYHDLDIKNMIKIVVLHAPIHQIAFCIHTFIQRRLISITSQGVRLLVVGIAVSSKILLY